MENLRARTILFVGFLLFCVVYLLPNAVKLPDSWWFHNRPLSYGLDIQGGAHLVYGVDIKGVLAERIERMARTLNEEFSDRKISFESLKPSEDKSTILIRLKADADRDKALAHLNSDHGSTLQVVKSSGLDLEVIYFDTVIQNFKQGIIQQAIEVIRNRVDEFGVAEPVISQQGLDRISVQLPGISDPAQAKALINKTARLDFRLVDEKLTRQQLADLVTEAEKTENLKIGGEGGLTYNQYVKKLNQVLKAKLPENTAISFEKAPQATSLDIGKIPYVIRTDTDISGDLLEDAWVSQDQFGKPVVSFKFGPDGRRKFSSLTGSNVGKQLAIVLDDVIFTAPSIKEKIDGQGQIGLSARNFEESQREGQLIATALRAGALPVSLEQLEERSVGPSLGADSIAKGKKAGYIGLALILVFMVIYYKMFGFIAALTLGLNVVCLLAMLSALGATLTLPGIAGIVLTIGMAVDANVIIFERIKEELARGSTMVAAVREGFDKAWSAIFDSNVTTAIAGAVLIYFGSGPVRGFGVTLIAGILTTMITAVYVTHYLLDLSLKFSANKKLPL